jgi:hypothetical protein
VSDVIASALWATVNGSGTVRVVVIDKDGLASGCVSIQVPAGRSGNVKWLLAPACQRCAPRNQRFQFILTSSLTTML